MSDHEDNDAALDTTSLAVEYTENDIARILIATDNHVGFMERDPIRGYDSFAAFEEILAVARREKVDCVFLAGDLFHENKPSRYTLWRTMEILRKYVMGPNPVRIQLLSDYNASRVLGSWSNPSSFSSSSSSTTLSSSSSSSSSSTTTRNPSSKQRGTTTASQRSNALTADEEIGESATKRSSTGKSVSSSKPMDDHDNEAIDPALQNPLAYALGHGGLFHRVNFEDPHYNIDLPIFCIHGNHDDPSREGPTGDILASLDMLSVANLVNYFGKSESADTIEVTPILLAKGQTRIALYGLGNLRDDRLHRVLLADKVRFRRPAQNPDDWFNILLFHQNRENRSIRGRMGNVGIESILPSFLDLVIWGHEHECILDLAIAQGRTGNGVERATRILQPGSSVATSLSDGESKRKHAILLEVRGSQFRRTPIPLRCVRPFRIEDVSLSSSGISPDAATVDEEVTNYLQGWVDAALRTLMDQQNQLPPNEIPPPALRLPLIRLKVEHSGFRVLSNQRFGAPFVGKVANPADILLFYRKPGTTRTRVSVPLPPAGLLRSVNPSEIPSLKVEDLVAEQLAINRDAGKGLCIVPQTRLVDAMGKYITGDVGAIRETVEETIIVRKSATTKHNEVLRAEELAEKDRKYIKSLVEKVNQELTKNEELASLTPEERRKREEEAQRRTTNAALQADSDTDHRSAHGHDDEEDEEERPRASTKGRGGKTAKDRSTSSTVSPRGGSRKRKASVSEEEEDDNQDERSSDESTSGGARGRSASSTTRGRRGGRGSTTTTTTTTGTRGRGNVRSSRNVRDDDNDDIEEEEEAYEEVEEEENDDDEEYDGSRRGSGRGTSRSSSSTKPAPKRARSSTVVNTKAPTTKKKSSDDPEDTEEEAVPAPSRRGSSTSNALPPPPPPPAQTSGSVFGGTNRTSVSASVSRDRSTSTARALPFNMSRK